MHGLDFQVQITPQTFNEPNVNERVDRKYDQLIENKIQTVEYQVDVGFCLHARLTLVGVRVRVRIGHEKRQRKEIVKVIDQ
jgi:hypothetical protein